MVLGRTQLMEGKRSKHRVKYICPNVRFPLRAWLEAQSDVSSRLQTGLESRRAAGPLRCFGFKRTEDQRPHGGSGGLLEFVAE